MDLTLLPSKKTVAKWESGLLVIAQGNSVIELTVEQATFLQAFILNTSVPATLENGKAQDLGV